VEYEESGEVNESFKTKALKHISQKQFDEIITNSYGGSGYFGLIISARDIVEAIRENKEEITGSDLVIGVHDGMNGSGYFVRAQAPYKITLKSARLDAGSYSIGDVFGHVDWKWR
jgi:hypothetical protein